MKPVVINDMETISITYRGLVHKLTEYEKLADTIETIYAMCDQKITHWADSITGKNGGKVKKYKRGKILYNSLKNNELERVSFFSLPENFVTAAFDYTIYISINYKDKYITAVFEKNILKNKKVEAIKNMLSSYMELPYTEEIYTMDKEETPLLYAARINPKSSFKTLKILSSKNGGVQEREF